MGLRRQRGVTLVEVAITVAILALAVGVMLPALGNLSRADLRRAARILAGQLRETFENAALEGVTYRLTFDLKAATIKVESTDAELRLDARSGRALSQSALLAEFAPKDGGLSAGAGNNPVELTGPLAAVFRLGQMDQAGAEVALEPRGTWALADGVRFLDVWTEGLDGATTDGQTFLYFFPGGFTQEALIHLQDADHRAFTVAVAALTGKVHVADHYVEVQK